MASLARRTFEAGHSDPLLVYFSWPAHDQLPPRRLPALATAAAALVAQHRPTGVLQSVRLDWDKLHGTPLANYLYYIDVIRTPGPGYVLWAPTEASWLSVSISELQTLINAKELKLPDYRTKCARAWLVITAADFFLSSHVAVDADVRQHHFTSGFERVLVYDRAHGEVIRLLLDRDAG